MCLIIDYLMVGLKIVRRVARPGSQGGDSSAPWGDLLLGGWVASFSSAVFLPFRLRQAGRHRVLPKPDPVPVFEFCGSGGWGAALQSAWRSPGVGQVPADATSHTPGSCRLPVGGRSCAERRLCRVACEEFWQQKEPIMTYLSSVSESHECFVLNSV